MKSKLNTNKFLNYIRENGPVKRLEMAELFDVAPMTISRNIEKLRHMGYEIVNVHGKGYKLIDEPVTCEERSDKNHEGYPDPTAAQALKNLSSKVMENGIKVSTPIPTQLVPGDIFEMERYGDVIQYVFVSQHGPSIYAVPLVDGSAWSNQNYLCVNICQFVHKVADCNRLFSFDGRKVTILPAAGRPSVSEAELAVIRNKLAELLGIPTVTITEPKTTTDMEHELLRQRADIYEKCFYAVCGKGAQ